jgi:hypothetical protein
MVIRWRRNRTDSSAEDHPDPSEDPESVRMYEDDNGLGYEEQLRFASRMGHQPVPR